MNSAASIASQFRRAALRRPTGTTPSRSKFHSYRWSFHERKEHSLPMWPGQGQCPTSLHDCKPVRLRNSSSPSSSLGTHPVGFRAIIDHVSRVDGTSQLTAR